MLEILPLHNDVVDLVQLLGPGMNLRWSQCYFLLSLGAWGYKCLLCAELQKHTSIAVLISYTMFVVLVVIKVPFAETAEVRVERFLIY